MNQKRWATFFVFLISSNYLSVAMAAQKCTPKPKMHQEFTKCFERVRAKMPESVPLNDDVIDDNMQLSDGEVTGLQNFKMHPPACACFRDFVRVFIKISFIDITVTFLVTLLDGLLGGLLGNLGSTLSRVVGQVLSLLVSILALEITVVIAVDQRFIPGSKCKVSSYRVTRISEISILNLDLTQLLVGLLGNILVPVVDTLLKNLLERQVRAIIVAEIEKMTITEDMYTCGPRG